MNENIIYEYLELAICSKPQYLQYNRVYECLFFSCINVMRIWTELNKKNIFVLVLIKQWNFFSSLLKQREWWTKHFTENVFDLIFVCQRKFSHSAFRHEHNDDPFIRLTEVKKSLYAYRKRILRHKMQLNKDNNIYRIDVKVKEEAMERTIAKAKLFFLFYFYVYVHMFLLCREVSTLSHWLQHYQPL